MTTLIVLLPTLLLAVLFVAVATCPDPEYREARRRYHAPCDQCGHQYRLHYNTPTTVGCAYLDGEGENCGCGIFVGETSRRV